MNTKDNVAHWIARHLPARLVYWCAISLAAYATAGEYSQTIVPELTVMDAMDRWRRGKLVAKEKP